MDQLALPLFWTCGAVLLYAHVVYPWMMVCVAKLRTAKTSFASRGERLVRVSLVIPAANEERVIRASILNKLDIDYPSELLQIIVASDGSQDQTVVIANGFRKDGVQTLEFPRRRGKSSVLNDAVEAADGDVLCFCDANVMVRPDALSRLLSRLGNADVGAVTGDVRLLSQDSNFGKGEEVYYRIERAVQEGESIVGSVMGVDGGMYIMRRELFQKIPADTILDDFVNALSVLRQGYRVAYEPTAVAEETATLHARQEFQRRVRVSAGAAQCLKRGQWPTVRTPLELWQFISHKVLRWFGPFFLLGVFVSNAALFGDSLFFQITLAAQVAFYALGAAATFVMPLRRSMLGGVTFYFVMSHVAMVCGLVKGLFNLQPSAWRRSERAVAADRSLQITPRP